MLSHIIFLPVHPHIFSRAFHAYHQPSGAGPSKISCLPLLPWEKRMEWWIPNPGRIKVKTRNQELASSSFWAGGIQWPLHEVALWGDQGARRDEAEGEAGAEAEAGRETQAGGNFKLLYLYFYLGEVDTYHEMVDLLYLCLHHSLLRNMNPHQAEALKNADSEARRRDQRGCVHCPNSPSFDSGYLRDCHLVSHHHYDLCRLCRLIGPAIQVLFQTDTKDDFVQIYGPPFRAI